MDLWSMAPLQLPYQDDPKPVKKYRSWDTCTLLRTNATAVEGLFVELPESKIKGKGRSKGKGSAVAAADNAGTDVSKGVIKTVGEREFAIDPADPKTSVSEIVRLMQFCHLGFISRLKDNVVEDSDKPMLCFVHFQQTVWILNPEMEKRVSVRLRHPEFMIKGNRFNMEAIASFKNEDAGPFDGSPISRR